MKRTIRNLQGSGGARYLSLVRLLFVAASLCLAGAAAAAEISALSWVSSGLSPVLQVRTQGKLNYEVSMHDGGKRLRISFPHAKLGPAVSDLSGRGPVKGVYPYLVHDGSAVNVDVLMNRPGQLKVVPTSFGYWVMASARAAAPAASPVPGGVEAASAPPVAAAAPGSNVIKKIEYLKLPGDQMQIRLKMAHPPATPAAFTIDNPPSISFDFADTRLDLTRNTVQVNQGAVSDVIAIQAQHRSRVVLSLLTQARYTTVTSGNDFIITVANPAEAASRGQPQVLQFATAVGTHRHSLASVVFRRGPEGDGRVIVGLSDSGVGINLSHQAGKITVDFLDTYLKPSLQRRLDVTDFATPVRYIDTFQHGRDVRMVIHAVGKYDHIAYQANDRFTVDIKPVTAKSGVAKVGHRVYTGKRLSLNFQNIDVRAALQVLADFTGLNFVASNDVKGNLTLRLNNVPWDQALAVILNAKGLVMTRSGNIITVETAAEAAAHEKVVLESAEQKQKLEPLKTALIQINYAKAASIAKLLKSIKAVNPSGQQAYPIAGSVTYQKLETESNTLLSPRGQVTVDNRTNSLLIQDIPEKIRQIRKLIAELDKPVRQVMIETRIVEATDNFARNLGVRLGVQSQTASNVVCGTLDCNAYLLTPNQTPLFTGNALSVNMAANEINAVNPGSLALTFMGLPNGNMLNLELSALQQEGRGKIISSPRIITSNEKKAVIESGQERTFQALGGGLGTQSFLTKNAVLKLEVTPQITPDNRVALTVHITNDSFNSASPTDSTMNKKRINTQVLLDNGETVVIGGIYQQTKQSVVSKVPFFGDLPLIGWAFRTTDVTNNRDELLVFLTPRILSNSLAMR